MGCEFVLLPSSWVGVRAGRERRAASPRLDATGRAGVLEQLGASTDTLLNARRHTSGMGEAFRDLMPGFEPRKEWRLKQRHVLAMLVWFVLEELELINKDTTTEGREATVGIRAAERVVWVAKG